jgi:lipoprotein-releasing system permease protein
MFRPLEVYIGLRYTRAKRKNHFISFISFTSMIGIALGITALITVLSVMNGFQKELRERILAMTSHASIIGFANTLSDWEQVSKQAELDPRVVAAAPFIRAEAMLTHQGRVSGALLRGVLPDREADVSRIAGNMIDGRLKDLQVGEFGIVLGRELALVLGAGVGDRITVVTPQANTTPVGVLPRLKRFTVVGIFEAGMYEYDRTLALVQLDDAQRLFRLEDDVTGVRLRLEDMFAAPRVAREIAVGLGGLYRVRDWTLEHANFFRAVQIEKTAMFVILMLIVAVAAFNIVSALVMVVTDKQADIAILRTLGSTPASVMGVFMVQGIAIGLVGVALGVAGGVGLATNVDTVVAFIEHLAGIKFLAPDVYYISDLPSEVHWNDVVLAGFSAFVLTLLATLYPAWRASRTRPAEALSYE